MEPKGGHYMAQKENKLHLIRMVDVPLTKVEWLWFPFIRFGKISIIQGNLGEGKTTLALRLAALSIPDRTCLVWTSNCRSTFRTRQRRMDSICYILTMP